MGGSPTAFTRVICISSWDRLREVLLCGFACSSMDEAPGDAHGSDVDEQGNGTVSEQRLHQLIRQSGSIEDRLFEIEFLDAGAEAFAFTFG